MKTGQYYFDKLSEVEQIEFTENCVNQHGNVPNYILNGLIENFESLICSSFSWTSTTQGFDYWQNIANRKVD